MADLRHDSEVVTRSSVYNEHSYMTRLDVDRSAICKRHADHRYNLSAPFSPHRP